MFGFGLFVFAAVFVLPFVALALIVWGAVKYFKYKAEVDKLKAELEAKREIEIEKNNTTLAKLENLQPIPDATTFAEAVTKEYALYAEPHPLPAIINALNDTAEAIYADQDLAPRKLTPKSNDAYDIAKWRDDVRQLAERNTDEIIPLVSKAFADMFNILHGHLPAPAVIVGDDEWVASMQPREEAIQIPLYAAMTDLIGFLTENCCGGDDCSSAARDEVQAMRTQPF